MLGLGLNIAKPYMLHEFDILSIDGLKMWYERNAAVLFREFHVQEWRNHSTLSSDYDLGQTDLNTMPTITNVYGSEGYRFQGLNELETNSSFDFFKFTIVITLNLNEDTTLTNEGLLGRGLNDLIKLYRGGSPTRIGYKLVGTNYEGNNMDFAYPTGDFVISFIRFNNGTSKIRINGEQVENLITDINLPLRYDQVGSGTLSGVGLDAVIYEVAMFDTDLSEYDLINVEDYLLSRI